MQVSLIIIFLVVTGNVSEHYIIKISEDKYRYFKCMKKIIMHTLLKKKIYAISFDEKILRTQF